MIPAFVNPAAGGGEAAMEVLTGDSRFAVRPVSAADLPRLIEQRVQEGEGRILVAGGDGTLALAARALLPHSVELAVLPAGTRNHFARSLGLTGSFERALDIAVGGSPRAVDVGLLNDLAFLNTSSVGGYVQLVRRRERLRPRLGYHLAAVLSAAALLLRLPTFHLELELDSRRHRYSTPLLFVGVGERNLKLPGFGERLATDGSGLHTIVVRGQRRARLLALALAVSRQGIWKAARTPHLDSFLVDRCRVDVPKDVAHVALDGEITALRAPLQYRLLEKALQVVVPERKPAPA